MRTAIIILPALITFKQDNRKIIMKNIDLRNALAIVIKQAMKKILYPLRSYRTMRLILSVALVVVSFPAGSAFTYGGDGVPKLPAIDIVGGKSKIDGSFEDTSRNYHIIGKLVTPPKIVVGTDAIPAVAGKHYLEINMQGGVKRRIGGTFLFRLGGIPIDLKAGRRFRIQWHARVQKPNVFKRNMASVYFVDTQSSNTVRAVLSSKIMPLKVGEWKLYQADFIYDGEEPVNNIGVRFGFFGDSDSGRLVEGNILFDDIRIRQINDPDVEVGRTAKLKTLKAAPAPVPPIAVNFTVPKDGKVTLVLEDKEGKRVRNLVEGVFYKKGPHTCYWDGLDNGKAMSLGNGRGNVPKRHLVDFGVYKVKGLVHDPLKLTYDMTVYPNLGPENVPWPTDLFKSKGGWLADHGMPSAAAFIPAGQSPYGKDVLAFASLIAEASSAMVYVDMKGKKLGGHRTLGGNWTGASHFATDRGEKRNPDIFLYSIKTWDSGKNAPENSVLVKILGFIKDSVVEVDYRNIVLPEGKTWKDAKIGGLAVHNGLLIFSEQLTKSLYLYDTTTVTPEKKAAFLKSIPLSDVKALAFSPKGLLLVVRGKSLESYDINRGKNTLENRHIVINNSLEDPQQMIVAPDGRIFIAEWGQSNQVQVYSSTGDKLYAIGKAGPCRAGAYEVKHMNHPFGMALDSQDRLWIVEKYNLPKRVGIWQVESGKLIRSYYGPPGYGGGGFLDPRDPDHVYWARNTGCMSFKLDRKAGTAIPDRIVYLTKDFEVSRDYVFQKRADFPYYHGKQRYIVNSYSGPISGSLTAEFWLDDGETARPMTFVGGLVEGFNYFTVDHSRLAPYNKLFAPGSKPKGGRAAWEYKQKVYKYFTHSLAYWVDTSMDGVVDKDEMTILTLDDRDDIGKILSTNIGKDFELLVVHTKGILRIPCAGFSDAGHPLYDITKFEPVVTGLNLVVASGNQALRCADGSIILTGGPMRGFKDNQELWSIHSQWPSLHTGHLAPNTPEYPGQMLATTRLLGPLVTPKTGEAGQVWGINSDKGVMYLCTADGYFLSTLGSLGSNARRWTMEEHYRGMDVTGVNYISENFYPSINQQPDGKIVLISGKTHISLIDVDGLETVKRFTAPDIVVDQAVHDQARDYAIAYATWEKRMMKQNNLLVSRVSTPVVIDGELDDWKNASWVTINAIRMHSGGEMVSIPDVQGAWAIDDKNLYVAIRSQKQNFVNNDGNDPKVFYSSGGGIDIRLATKDGTLRKGGKTAEPKVGDLRLVVAKREGKPVAILYKAKVPGTSEPVTISSPVGSTVIDKIEDISGRISLAYGITYLPNPYRANRKNVYRTAEVSIPLKLLGWDPKALPETIGDIGIILGQDGRAIERDYWHNNSAGIVSDLPSEAGFDVGYWGKVKTIVDKE